MGREDGNFVTEWLKKHPESIIFSWRLCPEGKIKIHEIPAIQAKMASFLPHNRQSRRTVPASPLFRQVGPTAPTAARIR
jgi:hypothetical protein